MFSVNRMMSNIRQSVLVMVAVGSLPVHVVLVHLMLLQSSECGTFEHETLETEARRRNRNFNNFQTRADDENGTLGCSWK